MGIMSSFKSDSTPRVKPKKSRLECVSVTALKNPKDSPLWPSGHGRPAVMKLSVATFRAGTERLNALMQYRQNRRTSVGPTRLNTIPSLREDSEDEEALLTRRVNSLDFSELELTKDCEPKTPRSATILGIFQVSSWNVYICCLIVFSKEKRVLL